MTVVTLTPAELQRLLKDTWDEARQASTDPEVLTADECAGLLRVKSTKTVTNYIAERGLPAHRLGQELRFRRSEVLDWLSKQTT